MRNPSLEKDLAVNRSARGARKEERPEVPEGTLGRPRTGYPESENLLLRSPSLGHRLNCGVCGLASGAPVFIPRRFATIWFTSVSAASRLNRGSASCSAHRRATAMWTGHAIGLVTPIENDQFSNWRRQYKERFSDAQEGSLLSPVVHIAHISTEVRARVSLSYLSFALQSISRMHPLRGYPTQMRNSGHGSSVAAFFL
jgi:hypothetical protein